MKLVMVSDRPILPYNPYSLPWVRRPIIHNSTLFCFDTSERTRSDSWDDWENSAHGCGQRLRRWRVVASALGLGEGHCGAKRWYKKFGVHSVERALNEWSWAGMVTEMLQRGDVIDGLALQTTRTSVAHALCFI